MKRRAILLLAAMAAMLIVVGGTALAITYTTSKKASLKLNRTSGVATALTKLVSNAVGPALTLGTDSTDPNAAPLSLDTNNGSQAPMQVDSEAKVANLNSDKVDGLSSEDFMASDGKAPDSDKLDGKDSGEFQGAYARTVVVSPVGTAAQNGTALLEALSGITSATEGSPYLLKIEPGTYDVGTSRVQMKEWVDIEGSGQETTTIKGAYAPSGGTVKGANNAELRFLTVENTGGGFWAIAIYNSSSSSPRLTHVAAKASGGTNYNYGVYNDSSSPAMNDVEAQASGGTSSYGVYNYYSSSPVIRDSTLKGSGGGSQNWALSSDSGGTVKVENSSLVGRRTVYSGTGVTTRIGASLLEGGAIQADGTLTCAGVHDEDYVFSTDTCPS